MILCYSGGHIYKGFILCEHEDLLYYFMDLFHYSTKAFSQL